MQDGSLTQQIADLLPSEDRDALLAAVELSRRLPSPAAEPDDSSSNCLFQLAFRAEHFEEFRVAEELYERVLEYVVRDTNILAGAAFRLGLAKERRHQYWPAMELYRQALELGHDWPLMMNLARLHWADLLRLDGRHGEAAPLYVEILNSAPLPDISTAAVRISCSKCFLAMGRRDEAWIQFQAVLAEPAEPHHRVAAQLGVAQLLEGEGNLPAARQCYADLLAGEEADIQTRTAAAYCLEAIDRRLR